MAKSRGKKGGNITPSLQISRENLFRVYLFSVLLYLLLRNHLGELALAIVDPEYPGFEPVTKNRVFTLCRGEGSAIDKDQLALSRIVKKSPAHRLAYRVYKGFEKPDRVLTAGDVLAEFRELRKRTGSSCKVVLCYAQGWLPAQLQATRREHYGISIKLLSS